MSATRAGDAGHLPGAETRPRRLLASRQRGFRSARLVALCAWVAMGVFVFYISELVPAMGTWARAQAWRAHVPVVFGLSAMVGLCATMWHIAVRPGWELWRRIAVAALVLPLTLFGLIGYYWFGVHYARAEPAEPESPVAW